MAEAREGPVVSIPGGDAGAEDAKIDRKDPLLHGLDLDEKKIDPVIDLDPVQAPYPDPVGVLPPFERDEGFDPAAAVQEIAEFADAGGVYPGGREQSGVVDHALDPGHPAHIRVADRLSVRVPDTLARPARPDEGVAEEPEQSRPGRDGVGPVLPHHAVGVIRKLGAEVANGCNPDHGHQPRASFLYRCASGLWQEA